MTELYHILAVFAGFFAIGAVGRQREKDHYKSIEKREVVYADVPILNTSLSNHRGFVRRTKMVSSTVVLADDQFKYFWALMRATFGGVISPYELIIDRARREALLRLKAEAPDADCISDVRLCHCRISRRIVEIVAYGTAVYWHDINSEPKHAPKL